MNNPSKKTSQSKIRHYVQQAYLKNFACDKNPNTIWMMDKRKKEIYEEEQEIKECAQYWFFYPQELEDWLNKNIENDGIKIIKKLLYHQDYNKLSDSEKKNLFEWIFVQYIRTPDFVNYVINTFNKLLSYISQKKEFILPKEIIKVFRSNNPNIQLLKRYYYRIVSLIWESIKKKTLYDYTWLEKEWIIFKNKTVFSYLTSDNPVILWKVGDNLINNNLEFEWISNEEYFLPKSFSFSLERGIMYFISLDPKTILLFCEKNPFQSSIIEQNNVSQVLNMNMMITAQSNRYIFSNENCFEHAFITIEKYPDCVKKENRNIISINQNQGLDYETFKIQNRALLNKIIKFYDNIDEERKETIFDSDFVL